MFPTGFGQQASGGQKRRRSMSPNTSSTSPTTGWPAASVIHPIITTPTQAAYPDGSSSSGPLPGDIGGIEQLHAPDGVPRGGPSLQQPQPLQQSPQQSQYQSQQQPKKRGTACEACRTKKSRCDSVRPVCGACAKARVECKYPSDSTLSIYETTSIHILDGITRIERLLADRGFQGSSEGRALSSPALSYVAPSAGPERRSASGPTTATVTPMQVRETDGIDGEMMQMTWQRSFLLSKQKGDYEVTLESVLSWPVFTQKADGSEIQPRCPYGGRRLMSIRPQHPKVDGMPLMTVDAIRGLISKFVRNIYQRYPIVDLDGLEVAVRATLEDGLPGWGLDACLVCLTCALGSISEDYGNFTPPSKYEPPPMRVEAWRWWLLAQKRLASAISENSVLAVQCQTLAGFWFMYNFEPLAAIKILNAACLSWQSLHLEAEAMSDVVISSQGYKEYQKQRLLWTAMTAESELRAELSLPLSDAARLEFPRDIPTPPSSDFRVLHGSFSDAEEHKAWFYYVGEIFLRRCYNRITNEITQYTASSGPGTVNLLVKTAKEFEVTLNEWRQKLPRPIKFSDPLEIAEIDGIIAPLPKDELQCHLRARYIDCFESLYRPFTEMVVLNSVDCDEETTQLASKGLAFCVLRMKSELLLYRHHKLWTECRASLLCALIIIAAARTKSYSVLQHIDLLELPGNWEEAMDIVQENLGRWERQNVEIEKYVGALSWARRWVSL